MEELTKTQIVLLTLLVSFVTSIATGIVTVALVDQSSAGVGQTIQTVVQRTIETVLPSTISNDTGTVASKPIQNNTPAPTESEQIVGAVARNSVGLVRIQQSNTSSDQSFIGLGVIISKDGTVLTDKGLLGNVNAKYVAVFPDGKVATLTLSTLNSSGSAVALFTVGTTTGKTLNPVIFGNSDKLALGEKIISLSGADKDTVDMGVISNFEMSPDNKNRLFINTNIDTKTKPYGSLLINLQGQIVGIKTSSSNTRGADYEASNTLKRP